SGVTTVSFPLTIALTDPGKLIESAAEPAAAIFVPEIVANPLFAPVFCVTTSVYDVGPSFQSAARTRTQNRPVAGHCWRPYVSLPPKPAKSVLMPGCSGPSG